MCPPTTDRSHWPTSGMGSCIAAGDCKLKTRGKSYKLSSPTVLNGDNNPGGFTLAVVTASDPLAFSVPIQRQIAELDPELPVSDVFTIQQIIERSLGNATLSVSLMLGFAVLSLILASVGLYGVLSYLTTQRTGEIGVRMALGAPREEVLRLMLGDGLRPALYGLTLGLVGSIGAVRLVQSMLYETRPLDPAIFASVAATLVVVAVFACLVPACVANRSDAGIAN